VFTEIDGAVVVHQRVVEVDHALVGQLHHQVGKHRLAERGGFKHGARVERCGGFHVAHAEHAAPGQRAFFHHRDAHAGHGEGLHQARQLGQEVVARDPRAVRPARCGERALPGQGAGHAERRGGGEEAAAAGKGRVRHVVRAPAGEAQGCPR
jgi:hypothetical protein